MHLTGTYFGDNQLGEVQVTVGEADCDVEWQNATSIKCVVSDRVQQFDRRNPLESKEFAAIVTLAKDGVAGGLFGNVRAAIRRQGSWMGQTVNTSPCRLQQCQTEITVILVLCFDSQVCRRFIVPTSGIVF